MMHKDLFLDTGTISLRLRREGAGHLPLVLLHELGGSLESFDAVVAAIGQDWSLLRYDQRGAGQSEKPRHAFSLQCHADDLAAILQQADLRPPYRLAGVAAGAAIAVAFALSRPADVAGLALCCPALDVAPDRRAYLADRSALAALQGMRAIEDTTLSRSFPPYLRQSAADFETYRARFLANDPVTYGYANIALADADLRIDRLAVPCLVLAGRHDLLRPPADVQNVAAQIPGASFAVLDSGHLMSVQAPEALGHALTNFFAARTGGA